MDSLSNVVAIAAGQYHNLALKSDGQVVGWGTDYYGQENPPPDLTGVMAIAVGAYHSMALKSNGTVVAWGSWIYTNFPARLKRVVAIAAGGVQGVALRNVPSQARFRKPVTQANGNIQLTFIGEPGLDYQVESSADLMHWTPLTYFTGIQTTNFVIDSAPGPPQRFYRAKATTP